jgi:hypothetical protein
MKVVFSGSYKEGFTEGKTYEVKKTGDGYPLVGDDFGRLRSWCYVKDGFTSLEEIRNWKLEKLGIE